MKEIGQPYLWRCVSLDIVYTSPPVMTVEEDIEDDSLPGFSMVLVLASTLLAMAVIRRR